MKRRSRRDGVRVRVGELPPLRSAVAPEEMRFSRSELHTRAQTTGSRETRPHGGSMQGFLNNFHVTELHGAAAAVNGLSEVTDRT